MINLTPSQLVAIVEQSVRDGRGDAMLIPWGDRREASQSIAASRAAFESSGWLWNPILEQLEKNRWYAWFRSQGALAAPIIQWGRVSTTPQYESPNKQFPLF